MGKWATYRKRGSQNAGPALPAPPPPTLEDDDDDFISQPNTAVNVGGFLILQRFVAPGTWNSEDRLPFTHPLVTWGAIETFSPGDYRALQTGNGANYAGTSEPSETFVI